MSSGQAAAGILLSGIAGLLQGQLTPSKPLLGQVAELLRTAAPQLALEASRYPAAQAGQELLYELAVDPAGGPSLYLVSDGAGTSSPPHTHQTWAVLLGLRGVELNQLFRLRGDSDGRLHKVGAEEAVGPGACLLMQAEDIHATRVRGESCYHLHLYGRALSHLPPFATRCFASKYE
ncbi:putative metal-dependent enzyme (double-stranded beta helix superfamily) [Paucibacter oligotrophus]|uniref:Putative metal-dependent enzyme (Double-stranded beta helix superfamily) n=1 Tax=Roseateles oligotrophus TaxID=1769250 RepID=A0A840LB38_9BURK|nr:hypothetical protein [Roseateles oligotrophus]MBB4843862.1 putative metal-dependent enzyme (double-stranded beta helix superfamily) [Roseateles oligotrophus]